MVNSLDQLLRLFIVDRAGFDRLIKAPVMLWEGPPLDRTTAGRDSWAPTEAGKAGDKPRAGETLVLTVAKVPNRANPFAMGVTIGRVGTNDIVIDDISISRFHAFLQQSPSTGAWSISDADSQNGSFVEGQRVGAGHSQEVKDGQALRFGEVSVRFFTPPGLVKHLEGIVTPS